MRVSGWGMRIRGGGLGCDVLWVWCWCWSELLVCIHSP
jgi:hypothetical protein